MTEKKKIFYLILKGITLKSSFEFSNGMTISKLSQTPDLPEFNELKNHADKADPSIIFKEVLTSEYSKDLFDYGVFVCDMISLNLNDHSGIEIIAASDFWGSRFPLHIQYGIRKDLDKSHFIKSDENLEKYNKLDPIEKEKIEIGIMYLNKSKICSTNINGNYEHAIFLRVALENIFNAPRQSKEAAIANRAAILYTDFDSKEIIQKFKRFYDQTSIASHTGRVPKKPKDNSKERKVKFGELFFYDMLVIAVELILEKGFPDWNKKTEPNTICSK